MKVVINETSPDTAFNEGKFVISKQSGEVYLVTVPATGYENAQDGTFWGICISDETFISGGNYRKDLFRPFHGKIVIEV